MPCHGVRAVPERVDGDEFVCVWCWVREPDVGVDHQMVIDSTVMPQSFKAQFGTIRNVDLSQRGDDVDSHLCSYHLAMSICVSAVIALVLHILVAVSSIGTRLSSCSDALREERQTEIIIFSTVASLLHDVQLLLFKRVRATIFNSEPLKVSKACSSSKWHFRMFTFIDHALGSVPQNVPVYLFRQLA